MNAAKVIHVMAQLQQDREGEFDVLMVTPDEVVIAELGKRGKLVVTVVPIVQEEREYKEQKPKRKKPGRFLG